MKAMQVVSSPKGFSVAPAEVRIPIPASDEILIRIHAAGVTPTELSWYPTTHTAAGTPRSLAIPGHEFSGVIEKIGDRVQGFTPGNEVFGMNDWYIDGASAEYCLAKPASIASKPTSVSHEEAATIPIGALTAWQGLFAKAHLQAGDRLLAHGGSGAVGLFVVQLAALHGATVIATASAANEPLLKSLGATTVIDYKTSRFEDLVHTMDLVFDTVGGETLQRSWSVLKPGGQMVTVAADVEGRSDQRAKDAFFIVEPDGNQLQTIARQIAEGKLKTFVKASIPLDQAPAAYANSLPTHLGYGKVVLTIPAPS